MADKIIVVDENDKVITSKERESLEDKDIYRVSALWLTNSRGDILLVQRAFDKDHSPGKWGPAVAGTVEEGETYESNIIKETAEEIGLENIKFKEGPKTGSESRYNYFTQWFLSTVDKPEEEFKVRKEEAAAVKWFSKEELKKELQREPDKFVKSVKRCLENFS